MPVRAARVAAWLLALVLLVGAVIVLADRLAPTIGDMWDPRPPEACTEPDPTTAGCLTPTARRLHDRTVETFGAPGPGVPVRAITCWAERPWNPGSDHPTGRACDVFPTRSGTFPDGDELAAGWAVANWARDNARELDVRYVIWQGRIWVRGRGDTDGWGRPYSGGRVYDPDDATGGHFDHVHVSVGP
jgi:hypothetical protein